jgi:hypothetical protein
MSFFWWFLGGIVAGWLVGWIHGYDRSIEQLQWSARVSVANRRKRRSTPNQIDLTLKNQLIRLDDHRSDRGGAA